MSASSQIIAVSPTNTIFSSSPISDISDEKTILSPSPISDTLSDDLIPGAPILCKSTRRSQIFWPAALLNDSGVEVPRRRLGHTTHFETLYSVRFCDGTSAKVPRSSFYTTTDQEFYSVKVCGNLTFFSASTCFRELNVFWTFHEQIRSVRSTRPRSLLRLYCQKSKMFLDRWTRFWLVTLTPRMSNSEVIDT
jgi:hypothetical protein